MVRKESSKGPKFNLRVWEEVKNVSLHTTTTTTTTTTAAAASGIAARGNTTAKSVNDSFAVNENKELQNDRGKTCQELKMMIVSLNDSVKGLEQLLIKQQQQLQQQLQHYQQQQQKHHTVTNDAKKVIKKTEPKNTATVDNAKEFPKAVINPFAEGFPASQDAWKIKSQLEGNQTGSRECSRWHFSSVALWRTALASHPGSGNTWTRYLIQQLTGQNIISSNNLQVRILFRSTTYRSEYYFVQQLTGQNIISFNNL